MSFFVSSVVAISSWYSSSFQTENTWGGRSPLLQYWNTNSHSKLHTLSSYKCPHKIRPPALFHQCFLQCFYFWKTINFIGCINVQYTTDTLPRTKNLYPKFFITDVLNHFPNATDVIHLRILGNKEASYWFCKYVVGFLFCFFWWTHQT